MTEQSELANAWNRQTPGMPEPRLGSVLGAGLSSLGMHARQRPNIPPKPTVSVKQLTATMTLPPYIIDHSKFISNKKDKCNRDHH